MNAFGKQVGRNYLTEPVADVNNGRIVSDAQNAALILQGYSRLNAVNQPKLTDGSKFGSFIGLFHDYQTATVPNKSNSAAEVMVTGAKSPRRT